MLQGSLTERIEKECLHHLKMFFRHYSLWTPCDQLILKLSGNKKSLSLEILIGCKAYVKGGSSCLALQP